MANIIPPVLSDLPPPLDPDLDDNEDNSYGDFRVTNDLGFDLSDHSRDSPDIWNTPSTNSEPSEDKESRTCISFPDQNSLEDNDRIAPELESGSSGVRTILKDATADNSDLEVTNDTTATSSDKKVVSEVVCNAVGDYSTSDKAHNFVIDNTDPPDVVQELANIPFSSKFDSCDFEMEERTSPEGADAESISGEFKPLDLSSELPSSTLPELACEPIPPATYPDRPVSESPSQVIGDEDDDDFADFADFSTHPVPLDLASSTPMTSYPDSIRPEDDVAVAENADDDFDDFECAIPTIVQEPNIKQEKTMETRLAEMLSSSINDVSAPCEDPELTGCLLGCLDDSSSVWGHLKDLDTSPALNLQWSASAASKMLLTSLNVDSRNILVGPRWNRLMPRFAANLTSSPLEPMKAGADAVPMTTSSTPSPPPPLAPNHTSPNEDVLPAAQFDWNGSGLTNPLDCVEKEAPHDESTKLTLEGPRQPDRAPVLPTPEPPHLPIHPLSAHNHSLTLATPTKSSSSETSDANESNNNFPVTALDNGMPTLKRLEINGVAVESVKNGSIPERMGAVLSAEACLVVDSLPDLSFLSARKLLFAANDNMNRFHTAARH